MSEPKHQVQDFKDVWIAWGNSDTTEGRGWAIPLHICALKATAERLGKGASVQGCDANVEKSTIYKIDGAWFGRVLVQDPSVADQVAEKARLTKECAIQRAKALGLTEADISAILQ